MQELVGDLSAKFLPTFVILIIGSGVVPQHVLYGGCTLIPFARAVA